MTKTLPWSSVLGPWLACQMPPPPLFGVVHQAAVCLKLSTSNAITQPWVIGGFLQVEPAPAATNKVFVRGPAASFCGARGRFSQTVPTATNNVFLLFPAALCRKGDNTSAERCF